MSPVGGVGISLAIQDSIATANILGEALSGNEAVNDELLAACKPAANGRSNSPRRFKSSSKDE
jgi:2-polyprenyl-6-methoxyphenol hydroxylase-like FAD-dependent oxidoreductase